ncbi:MAG: glucose 1-dehydrogenase, partial [Gammaproteobacteria bacterium]|nr:glucose 1-dehydrogenase [Gammaproteobacteria bacterium]
MERLQGKVAVITGGASGIGEAAVRLFVAEGCRVVIADLNVDAGQALAAELGPQTVFQATDVTAESEVENLVAVAIRTHGRLDCLFNNAGISGPLKPIEDVTVAEYDRLTAVNLKGVFLGMKFAAPIMKRQRWGSIVNTSSIGALTAESAPHLYGAVKAAVNHLTRCVANELGAFGVRVNSISPGAILTPIFAEGRPAAEAFEWMQRVAQGLAGYQPIPRAGRPEDVAQAALWLASDDSSFVTG